MLFWLFVSKLPSCGRTAGALGWLQWTLDQALGMSYGRKCKERLYFNILYSLAACCIFVTYWIYASLCVMFILKRRFLSLAKQKDFSRGGMAGSCLRWLSVKCYINDKILKEPVGGEQSFSFLFYAIFAEVSFPLIVKGNSFLLLTFFLSTASTTGSALIWVSQKHIYLWSSPSVPGNEVFLLISEEGDIF